MLIIRVTENGNVPNQQITKDLLEPLGNTVVRVKCEVKCYADYRDLENSICSYMNSFMPEGYEVKTSYVTLNQSTGQDYRGKYIEELDFQVYF